MCARTSVSGTTGTFGLPGDRPGPCWECEPRRFPASKMLESCAFSFCLAIIVAVQAQHTVSVLCVLTQCSTTGKSRQNIKKWL